MKKNFLLFLAFVALIVILGIVSGIKSGLNKEDKIACTMDARICPDGTAVGRVGPKCEFAECPTIK